MAMANWRLRRPSDVTIADRTGQSDHGTTLATPPESVIQPPGGNSDSKGALQAAITSHTSRGSSFAYQRHEPEKTVLYQIVSEHLETFLGEVHDHYDKPLPKYVEKELREYLRCGLLQYGFARAVCKECGRTILVAFSCKRRGTCPLCFVVTQPIEFTSKSEMCAADGSFTREFDRLRRVARAIMAPLRNIIRVGSAD